MQGNAGTYDVVIQGVSVLAVIIYTIFILKKFHVEHEGVMLLIGTVEAIAAVLLYHYFPKTTAIVMSGLGVAASVPVVYMGAKYTVFRKQDTVPPPPKDKPKLPDKLF